MGDDPSPLARPRIAFPRIQWRMPAEAPSASWVAPPSRTRTYLSKVHRIMSANAKRDRRRCTPGLESLEKRDVPASFGVPWRDPAHLSLSFVPDGTRIAG